MQTKNKIGLLVLGALVLLFASYQFAISNTISLKKEYKTLSREMDSFKNYDEELIQLTQKDVSLDSVLTKLSLNNLSVENSLIRFLDVQCKAFNTSIIDFNPTHTVNLDSGMLSTYNFKLQGNFTDLLKVLHKIETESKFGELSHVSFVKSKNLRTRKSFLQVDVLLQSYK
ncbi:MAG: hypothetical protein AAGD17_01470 [Bacteroidota bacterium]